MRSSMGDDRFSIMFANNVTAILKKRHMTQEKLADICGVSRVTLSRYMNMASVPNAIIVMRMAEALNVSSDYLLGLEDEHGRK